MSCGCQTCYQWCDVPQCALTLSMYVGVLGYEVDAHFKNGAGNSSIVPNLTPDADGFVLITIAEDFRAGWINKYNGPFEVFFTATAGDGCTRICIDYDGTEYNCFKFNVESILYGPDAVQLGPVSCSC